MAYNGIHNRNWLVECLLLNDIGAWGNSLKD